MLAREESDSLAPISKGIAGRSSVPRREFRMEAEPGNVSIATVRSRRILVDVRRAGLRLRRLSCHAHQHRARAELLTSGGDGG